MSGLSRRAFFRLASGAGLLLAGCAAGPTTRAKGARVVVVGGGYGGTTAAKYLRLADPTLQVTLVTPRQSFATCPFSNLVVAGLRDMRDITQGYTALNVNYDVDVRYGSVQVIDAPGKTLTLDDGVRLSYDRLIVAPGIEILYDRIQGYDAVAAQLMPHAWQAGSQTLRLRRLLERVPDGGTVLIAIPPAPFRGPSAPYERASLVAHYLKQFRPRSKVLVLDANESFTLQPQFQDGWQSLYPGMIEWVPPSKGGQVVRVDAPAGVVHAESGDYRPALANIIPPQAAGAIAKVAGLTDASGWCPVDPRSFESTLQRGIHVIGDACHAGPMPKSAFGATVQAKVCAQAVAALLRGETPAEPALLDTSYSLLGPDHAASVVAHYRIRDGEISRAEEGGETTQAGGADEALYAYAAYRNLVVDAFGLGPPRSPPTPRLRY